MTTRKQDTSAQEAARDHAGRRTRPRLDRTGPVRSIVNAFYQPDAGAGHRVNGRRFEDDNVWGAGGATPPDPSDTATSSGRKDGEARGRAWGEPFEAVRAAYGVVNDQIRAGYEEAARLNAAGQTPLGRKLPQILNRLMQTYSDLGTQWIDLILATAESRDGAPGGKQGHSPSPAPAEMSLAVDLTTARPARARALLYRQPAGALTAWPLRREGAGGEIAAVAIGPGPVVTVEIGADTQPGLYRGIVIEDGVEQPAGSVIVTVLGERDE